MKLLVIAGLMSVMAMGCAMTPKHGNRGPASVNKATPAAATCEDALSNKCDPKNPNCKSK